jgi:hypothetical protein
MQPIPNKAICTYSLERLTKVIIVETGKGIFVTKCLLALMEAAPPLMASLIYTQGRLPIMSHKTKGCPLTLPDFLSPNSKVNQYTKIRKQGFTNAQIGPRADPL